MFVALPNLIHTEVPRAAEVRPVSVRNIVEARVVEIHSLAEIPSSEGQKLYLLDLDDTVFVHPFSLGSRKWRSDIKAQMTQLINEDAELQRLIPSGKQIKSVVQECHDCISYALACMAPVATVEPAMQHFIHDLQEKGHIVWGLTARERNIWYYTPQAGVDRLTAEQLSRIGIDLERGSFTDRYPSLSTLAHYAHGIHFAPHDVKGLYLQEEMVPLFTADGFPDEVVFVDDTITHIESMAEHLGKNGIPHTCYHYRAADQTEVGYDPLVANVQLFHFYASHGETILSDEQARELADLNPEKNAETCLRPVLVNILNKLYQGE